MKEKRIYGTNGKLNQGGSLKPNHTDNYLNINEITTSCKKTEIVRLYKKTYRLFTKIDHILGHKANINKFQKTENILGLPWWCSG